MLIPRELREEPRQELWRDAASAIDNADFNSVQTTLDFDFNHGSGRRELDRVVQQIPDDRQEPVGVDHHAQKVSAAVGDYQRCPRRQCQRFCGVDGILERCEQIVRRRLQVEDSRLDTRDIQQIIRQGGETPAAPWCDLQRLPCLRQQIDRQVVNDDVERGMQRRKWSHAVRGWA